MIELRLAMRAGYGAMGSPPRVIPSRSDDTTRHDSDVWLLEELEMMEARTFSQPLHRARREVADSVASYEQVAAMEAAGELINRKWKLAILFLLAQAPHRYNALLRTMPGVTPKMLTQQLRALEDSGVVEHIHGPGRAKHTEYRLTAIGDRLRPTLDTLAEFACDHIAMLRPERAEHQETTLRRVG